MSKSSRRSHRVVSEKDTRAPDKSRQTAERGAHWVRQDKLLDEALEQTFPASDPLSSMQPAR
jgi:hypothetical protein